MEAPFLFVTLTVGLHSSPAAVACVAAVQSRADAATADQPSPNAP